MRERLAETTGPIGAGLVMRNIDTPAMELQEVLRTRRRPGVPEVVVRDETAPLCPYVLGTR